MCDCDPDPDINTPNPGWCMTASEEPQSRAERRMSIPDKLYEQAADELGI